MSKETKIVSEGLSFGSALAAIISWSINHSVLWACIHGILSWLYIIYYLLGHAGIPTK